MKHFILNRKHSVFFKLESVFPEENFVLKILGSHMEKKVST